jgi:hypothetical protein
MPDIALLALAEEAIAPLIALHTDARQSRHPSGSLTFVAEETGHMVVDIYPFQG